LIICNNKVLRLIRFCFWSSHSCYPNSFGTGSHCVETISASAFALERTENINVAVTSTARAACRRCRRACFSDGPRGAWPQFSAPAHYRFGSIPSLVAGRREPRPGPPTPETGNAVFACKRAPLEVVASN
jgi:hypothetical protein